MSRFSSFCCCFLFLVLVHSSQSTNPFDQFGVYCKPETFGQRVSKTGCDSKYIRVKACLGTCASYAYPLDRPPYFKKFCECCKPSATRWKVFNLPNCASGISPLVQLESAVNCKCSACTWKRTKSNTELETDNLLSSLWYWKVSPYVQIEFIQNMIRQNVILVSRNICVTPWRPSVMTPSVN